MKTYRIYATVAICLLLGNCKPDELTTDVPTPNQSGARAAGEVKPIKLWDVTYGGETTVTQTPQGEQSFTGKDELETAVALPDGGILLAGSSDSPISGNKTTPLIGGYDYWLVNLDKNGAKRGMQTVGSTGDDKLKSVLLTNDGGYLLGGSSNSPKNYDPNLGVGHKTRDSRGFDFWVVKLDASGRKKWDVTTGGTGNEWLTTMVSTPDGGYLLGGSTASSADTRFYQDGIDHGNRGQNDYWIVKIDANGKKLWDQSYGTANSEEIRAIVPTADGGFILAGQVDTRTGPWNVLSGDYWLVKIDASGNKMWDKTLGTSGDDQLSDAIVATDGGILLGGSSTGSVEGDKSQAAKGRGDYWIVKVDGSGNKLWDKTIGTSSYEEFVSVVATADGGYLLGGSSAGSVNGDKTENSRGSSDYWLVKINAQGRVLWDKTVGGSYFDIMTKLVVTADDGILAAGISSSPRSGEKTQGCFGDEDDYWAVKLK